MVTLALSPPDLEDAFWRDVGTPAFTHTDTWALPISILDMTVSLMSSSHVETKKAVQAFYIAQTAASIAAYGLLLAAPARYRGNRERLALAQRACRGALMLMRGRPLLWGRGRGMAPQARAQA
ncbi:MAG: hypothetical protein J3K34DRAFT_518886 [Monoraphidium minutum]|nr:MAG: hypothetical protein J3K34DRAFT_518886 [Monoraphidium minutum]